MSGENVEFLRQGCEALQRGNVETFEALSRERLDPEFAFHHVWDGCVFKGYEGTLEWISDTSETWDDYSQQLTEIIDLGKDVVVVVRLSALAAACRCPRARDGASRATGRCEHGRSPPGSEALETAERDSAGR